MICKPWGVGVSFKIWIVLSQRLMMRPVSTVMNLGGTTEVLLGRADKAHKEGGMGDK